MVAAFFLETRTNSGFCSDYTGKSLDAASKKFPW
jgi:hypothetical protein